MLEPSQGLSEHVEELGLELLLHVYAATYLKPPSE